LEKIEGVFLELSRHLLGITMAGYSIDITNMTSDEIVQAYRNDHVRRSMQAEIDQEQAKLLELLDESKGCTGLQQTLLTTWVLEFKRKRKIHKWACSKVMSSS